MTKILNKHCLINLKFSIFGVDAMIKLLLNLLPYTVSSVFGFNEFRWHLSGLLNIMTAGETPAVDGVYFNIQIEILYNRIQ